MRSLRLNGSNSSNINITEAKEMRGSGRLAMAGLHAAHSAIIGHYTKRRSENVRWKIT